MTPNLTSARKAIEAELLHAKQGMEFYSSRVEALEAALTQLESVDMDDAQDDSEPRRAGRRGTAGAKRGRKPRAASDAATQGAPRAARKGKAAGARKKAAGRNGSADALPTTGLDFWVRLVTDEPRTAVEIANAAAREIGLGADQKDQIQKLKQRVAPALTALVSAGKVKDSGAGRERRFFRSGGQGDEA